MSRQNNSSSADIVASRRHPSEPIAADLDTDSEENDLLKTTRDESPISTRLSGPQEPLSDRSTSQPSPKSDKGKAKMPDYDNN